MIEFLLPSTHHKEAPMRRAPVDGIAATAQLQALAGKTSQPLHQQLTGIAACTERLATGTRAWPAFAPRPSVLDEAINTADGLARALRELRATMAGAGE